MPRRAPQRHNRRNSRYRCAQLFRRLGGELLESRALLSVLTQPANDLPVVPDGSVVPRMLEDINRVPAGIGLPIDISHLTAIGQTVYFNRNDGISGLELWKTDGTG